MSSATPTLELGLTLTGPPKVRRVLRVPGPLPGLNEILRAKLAAAPSDARGRRPNGYARLKRRWAQVIGQLAHAAAFKPLQGAHAYTYVWCEADRRRDPSNFTSGGRKILEDALTEAGLLEGDGWAHVRDLRDHWLVCPERLGVTVIVADRVLERAEALALVDGSPPPWQRLGLPAPGALGPLGGRAR